MLAGGRGEGRGRGDDDETPGRFRRRRLRHLDRPRPRHARTHRRARRRAHAGISRANGDQEHPRSRRERARTTRGGMSFIAFGREQTDIAGGGGGRRARAHTHGARRESERETVGEKLRKRGGMVGPRFLEGSGVRVCAEEEGLVGCYGRGGQVGGCTERVRRWLSKWSVGCECEAGVSEKGRRAGAWGGGRGRRRGEG